MKWKKSFKRLIAVFLCAAMVITYMPFSVYTFAEASNTDTSPAGQEVPAAADAKAAEPASESEPVDDALETDAAQKAEAAVAESEEEKSAVPEVESADEKTAVSDAESEEEKAAVKEAEPAEEAAAETEPAEDQSADYGALTSEEEKTAVSETETTDEQTADAVQDADKAADAEDQAADVAEEKSEEEVPYPAQSFKGAAGNVRVSVEAPEGALPKGSFADFAAVSTGAVADAVKEKVGDSAEVVAAVDITFKDKDGKEIEPEKQVLVSFASSEFNKIDDAAVVHIADNGAAEKLADSKVEAEGSKVEFSAKDFSVYAVVDPGDEDADARLTVNFVQADGETTVSMIVTKAQLSQIEQYIYDPGIGELPEGTQFRGWTDEQNYTADTEGLTVADVREAVRSKLNDGVSEGDEITYYAMVFKAYTVTFLDEEGVTIRNDQKLYRTDDEGTYEYEVNQAYTPYVRDEDEAAGITAQFDGWQQVDPVPEEPVVYQNGESFELTSDVTLRATIKKGYWISYNENLTGASYTVPELVSAGEHPTEPKAPTCAGYTFEGWYTEDADPSERDGQVAGDLVDFSSLTLTKNTTVHAKWTQAEEAEFTVLVWEESLRGGYDFVKSIKIENAETGAEMADIIDATVGASTIKVNGENVFIGLASDANTANAGFTYEKYDSNNDGKVLSSGTSVLNVYFVRREYTLKFYYGRGTANGSTPNAVSTTTSTVSGPANGSYANGSPAVTFTPGTDSIGNYKYYYYSVTAKYGENISDKWPSYDMFGNAGNYRLVSWVLMRGAKAITGSGSGENTVKGKLTVMDEQVLGDLSNPTGNFLIASYYNGNPNNWTYNIYFADDNGTVTYKGKTYSLKESIAVRSRGSDEDSQHAPAYPGYDNDGGEKARNSYVMSYYYSPKEYSILFMDGIYQAGTGESAQIRYDYHTNTLGTVDGIEYGADVSEYKDYEDTDLQKSMHNYVFLGWYADSACENLYDFTTMPEGGITVYAKWLKKEYKVVLHPNDDESDPIQYSSESQKEEFYVENGSQIGNVGGERNYYDLAGWFADEAFTKSYDFDLFKLNDDVVSTLGKLYSASEIDPDYPNIVGEINLYAKWRSRLTGSSGINVVYDATDDGENAPLDENNYVDLAEAIAMGASTAKSDDKVFSHWLVQKWNGDSYEDTSEKVLPGETFVVKADYAKITDEDGNVVSKSDLDPKGKYNYTVQLKAVYIGTEKPMSTSLNWYNNYDGGLVASNEDIEINATVNVPEAPERSGYKFLGWVRGVEETEASTTSSKGITTLTDLFITYTDGSYDITQVAVDELLVNDNAERGTGDDYKYHNAMFALWEATGATVTVHHYLKGTETKVAEDSESVEDIGTEINPADVPESSDFLSDFDGYTLTKDSTDPEDTITVTADGAEITLYYTLPLTITASSDSKVYDGEALTKDEAAPGDGQLLNGDSIDSVTVTGSQTLVGSSDNVASDASIFTSEGAEAAYYIIEYVKGTLTVTDGSGDDETPVDPALVVTKADSNGSGQTYKEGDTVTFDITATNIYEEAQTITLSEIDGVTLDQAEFTDVAGGETVSTTASYTITAEDAEAGSFTNTVTASLGNITKTASASVNTEKDDPEPKPEPEPEPEDTSKPAISVTKTADITSGLEKGDTVTYTVKVKNTGNVALSSITVSDTLVKLSGGKGTIAKLAAGASKTITYNYIVTTADVKAGRVKNTASASGTAPDGKTVKASDSVVSRTEQDIDDDEDDDDDDDDGNPPSRVTPPSGGTPTGGGTPTNGGTPTGGGTPGGNIVPGGDGSVVPADPGEETVVPDVPTPETEPETVIPEPDTPLAEGTWALINLICAIATTLGAVVALLRKKEDDDEEDDKDEEDDNRGKKMLASKIAGAAAGIAAPVAFILTEDMSLPMAMTDKWTILMAVILVAQVAAAVLNKKSSEAGDEEDEE